MPASLKSGFSIRMAAKTVRDRQRAHPGICDRSTTAGSRQRRNGWSPYLASVLGRVGLPASLNFRSRPSRERKRAALPGSTVLANPIFASVYSWPQTPWCRRKRDQLLQRRVHLLRRAFEEPPAAAGEQRVATEKGAGPIIGNVRARVAGNVEHRKSDAEPGNAHLVALGHGVGERRDRLVARAVDGDRIFFQQLRDPANVVGMVVGGKDRHELELLAREILEHRPAPRRVDHGGIAPFGPAWRSVQT